MTNILNWPDYNVVNVAELEHDYQVQAEVAKPPTHCPHCNHREIVGFGRRDEVIMDTPVHGKRTGIMLNRRRYQRQRIPNGAMGKMAFYGVAETGSSTNYGADISTRVQEIEAGHL